MDLDILIARVAEARSEAQLALHAAKEADRLKVEAYDRLDNAHMELRQETQRRIDEITPPKSGDRIF